MNGRKKKILAIFLSMSAEEAEESKYIGGNRVLLVRKYTGGRRRVLSSSPTKKTERCLLEREVKLVDTTEEPVQRKMNYGLIGTGAVAATALIGAWFYVQNSD